MPIYSFHLIQTNWRTVLAAQAKPPDPRREPGLWHAEAFGVMQLGAPLFSRERHGLHQLALFAAWENETALEAFLDENVLGRQLAKGWHLRLDFLRQWGQLAALQGRLPPPPPNQNPGGPIVAVTLARLRLPELPRFIRWGRPVETQVRDHSGQTLALAGLRPPRTFCTFSIWQTLEALTGMVRGREGGPSGDRHAKAMAERKRRDFHHEFTTLRFLPRSEHGLWEGRGDYVPIRV